GDPRGARVRARAAPGRHRADAARAAGALAREPPQGQVLAAPAGRPRPGGRRRRRHPARGGRARPTGADPRPLGRPAPEGARAPFPVRRLLRGRQLLVGARRADGREGERRRLPAARGRDRARRQGGARRLPRGVPEATVALPFTSSLAAATRRLKRVPLSGQTPLADALRRARILLRQELSKHPNAVPLVVVVTDGEPTVPLRAGSSATADTLAEGRALRR